MACEVECDYPDFMTRGSIFAGSEHRSNYIDETSFYDALWTCGRVGWCVYHTHHTFLQRLIYVVGSMICCCGSKPFDPSLLDCCLLILLQKGESLPVVPISGHGMVCRFERTPSFLLLHHCLLSHLTLRLTAILALRLS